MVNDKTRKSLADNSFTLNLFSQKGNLKNDTTFSSVEDFIVDGDDAEQTLGFLSSIDEVPSSAIASGAGHDSDRYTLNIGIFIT